MATQNPIEQEGTYPLPEAQVDRFMLKVNVGYLARDQEMEVVERSLGGAARAPEPVVSPEDLRAAQEVLQLIYVDEKVKEYAAKHVETTHWVSDEYIPKAPRHWF